jgi:hypothetical protein
MQERSRQDERLRANHLLGLLFCCVTGFNLVLLYRHALAGNWGWFMLILPVCVLFPGIIPYLNLVQAFREGRLKRWWREPVAILIGGIDSIAILSHWPEALIDVSWISTFIIGSAAAFLLVAQPR